MMSVSTWETLFVPKRRTPKPVGNSQSLRPNPTIVTRVPVVGAFWASSIGVIPFGAGSVRVIKAISAKLLWMKFRLSKLRK